MSPESLIITYGYPILFLGTILEGESFLLIAAGLAYSGYLDLRWVGFFAFLGAFSGDQLFFHIGRIQGTAFLEKRPRWKSRMQRANELLKKYDTLMIIGFRFLYGLRGIFPFMIGMSGVSIRRFTVLNVLGILLWTGINLLSVCTLGQIFSALLAKYE